MPRLTTDQSLSETPLSPKTVLQHHLIPPKKEDINSSAASISCLSKEGEEGKEKKTKEAQWGLNVPTVQLRHARDPYRRVRSRAASMRNWRGLIGTLDRGTELPVLDSFSRASIRETYLDFLLRRFSGTLFRCVVFLNLPFENKSRLDDMIAQRVGVAALRRGMWFIGLMIWVARLGERESCAFEDGLLMD